MVSKTTVKILLFYNELFVTKTKRPESGLMDHNTNNKSIRESLQQAKLKLENKELFMVINKYYNQ